MQKTWHRVRIGVLAVIVGMLGVSNVQAELKVGDQAPEFKLKGSDGKVYALADFRGKKAVVVAWYPKAFTGGWTKECISFRENGKALRAYEIAYFTASCDEEQTNKKFAEELELDYPILSDPTGKVATAYGIYNEQLKFPARKTFIIGKDGKILFIFDKVDVGKHGAEIAEQLGKLKVDKRDAE